MNFVEAMTAAQAGFDTWAAKPHNKKWAKMVYHTPIPNDLLVNIAEAFCRASPAPLPTGNVGEAVCESYGGRGTQPDYVGDDMRCVETGCDACNGTGRAAAPPKPVADTGVDALTEALRKIVGMDSHIDASPRRERKVIHGPIASIAAAALTAASQRSGE